MSVIKSAMPSSFMMIMLMTNMSNLILYKSQDHMSNPLYHLMALFITILVGQSIQLKSVSPDECTAQNEVVQILLVVLISVAHYVVLAGFTAYQVMKL